MSGEQAETVVQNVRRLSGIPETIGPTDNSIYRAVNDFVDQFEFWYIRVMREAVPKYRSLIIARINPFIRRIEYEGLNATQVAAALVSDYNNRNFVTAGGWALEAMAVAVNPANQKSSTQGIDLQQFDPDTGDYHLYVLKSGLVTRNADILSQLKANARRAEKTLKQSHKPSKVHAYYAILAGKTTSSFEDGIYRPSSADFWSRMMNLEPDRALSLALAIAAEAGRLVRRDASTHIAALKLLVRLYVEDGNVQDLVDWDFIINRTMREKSIWKIEDGERHKRAWDALNETHYVQQAEVTPDLVDGSLDEG